MGRGTGVDDAGLYRKTTAIEKAIALHGDVLSDPLRSPRRSAGANSRQCWAPPLPREQGVPLMLDGFVSTAAVAPLAKLHLAGLAHALSAHVSAEAGHRGLLEALGLEPLLDLGMRLGEGSGGCLAINILRCALACHTGMASFAEAGVSEGK